MKVVFERKRLHFCCVSQSEFCNTAAVKVCVSSLVYTRQNERENTNTHTKYTHTSISTSTDRNERDIGDILLLLSMNLHTIDVSSVIVRVNVTIIAELAKRNYRWQ